MFRLVPRAYTFTITEELDADYLKYLHRRLRDYGAPELPTNPVATNRLDISLDDPDGDIVAGIAAWTTDDVLVIDLLWVDEPLRGLGFGQQLMRMAEAFAFRRGCTRAQVEFAPATEFYQKIDYSVSARLVQFPSGSTFYRLHKTLGQPVTMDFELYPKIAL
jgi:GNAT superfamily N-acetyltransferase